MFETVLIKNFKNIQKLTVDWNKCVIKDFCEDKKIDTFEEIKKISVLKNCQFLIS